MRTLSHEGSYGRDELVDALLRAGQFAHMSEGDISGRLNMVAAYGGADAFARFWKVPAPGGPVRFSASVVCWIAVASPSHVFCCLCGMIDTPPINQSPQLARALCPTWLSVTGPPRMEAYPFCRKCNYTLQRLCEPFSKELRRFTFRWSFDGDRDVDVVLALLLANPSFRRRGSMSAPKIQFGTRRSVDEWIGSSPDAKVPDHVRQRIWIRCGGRCHIACRKIRPGEPWDLDHITALRDGGEHRESNLAPALKDKHREKTAAENSERADASGTFAKHFGTKNKSGRKIPQRKDPWGYRP
jgi:5-methylcytosine-specific restriction protein A